MQTFENLLQNCLTKFLDITHKSSLGMCIKVYSNGGSTYINSKLIAKANLNIAIVIQTFENLILQNCSTEFYDIAHTWSLGMCN